MPPSAHEGQGIEQIAAEEIDDCTAMLLQGAADALRAKRAEIESLLTELHEACSL